LTTISYTIAGTYPDAFCWCVLTPSPFLYYYDQSEPPNITVAMNSTAGSYSTGVDCGICGGYSGGGGGL
jgi:hypothetical protein